MRVFTRMHCTCHPGERRGSADVIAGRRSSKEPCGDMEGFERELHDYAVAVERELLGAGKPSASGSRRRSAAETVSPEAVMMAVSLDGVMVPMKDGQKSARRPRSKASTLAVRRATRRWGVGR